MMRAKRAETLASYGPNQRQAAATVRQRAERAAADCTADPAQLQQLYTYVVQNTAVFMYTGTQYI